MSLNQDDVGLIKEMIAMSERRTKGNFLNISFKFVVKLVFTVAICWTVLTQTNLNQWQAKFFINGEEVTKEQFENL